MIALSCTNSRVPATAQLLAATPAVLALALAVAMPQLRLQWLALLLLATGLLTLIAPLLHDARRRPAATCPVLGPAETFLLLLALLCAALLLPLPAGLLLLTSARLALTLRYGTTPGFPLADGALLLGLALSLPAA